ncbi:uncharacterized protein LOC116171024 isoform X2 [Photinus pyralis]|nr:uncharacterized protein LOC116171024 isoform X2 [Photinus pyralis]
MFQHETLDADSDVPYIDCQDVRITPARMVFENAFESKTFYEKFTILNRGSKAAFVRIGAASSYAFKVKTLLRGQKLCPGLTIERSVKFQCLCGSSVPTSTLPIYINGERIDYKIYVLLCSVDLKAEPATLNFDVINGGPNAAVRILSVRNDGTRSVRFNIDLGGNAMEFIVEPAKGIIQPKSTTYFRVECLSTTEGQFSKEFWIKCETPLRVGMVGKIIRPQLQVIHENALRHFTFIDFPKTYVGTSTSKLFLIKNFSSLPGIYCILAEVDDTIVDLRYASRKQADFQNFSVKQVEGIMEKFESRIVEVTYTPSKSKRSASKAYTFCCLRIMRVPCGTQRVTDLKEKLFSSERNTSVRQLDDLVSISSEFYAMGDSEESLLRIVSPEKLEGFSANNSNNIVRVVLFGESLEPSVKVRPDTFDFQKIKIQSVNTRELFLSNESEELPIIFLYQKKTCVEIQPKMITLQPKESVEVSLTVVPTRIGDHSTTIVFDLLFYNRPRQNDGNIKVGEVRIPIKWEVLSETTHPKAVLNMGITPNYIKEVGMFTDDIRFTSKVQIPRATLVKSAQKKRNHRDNDLIAFPNDRPKTLRPWTSNAKYRTICADIIRGQRNTPDEFQFAPDELRLKKEVWGYYKNYLNSQSKQRPRRVSSSMVDYEVTDVAQVLLDNVAKTECSQKALVFKSTRKFHDFIPLTPSQLIKIKIYPPNIHLGKVAPKSFETAWATIHNGSNVDIFVNSKCSKSAISFSNTDVTTVKSASTEHVQMYFTAGSLVGRFSAIVDFVINASDVYSISVTAEIVPRCVKLAQVEIRFTNEAYKFAHISNPVNVPVHFFWKVPESQFAIYPMSATIASRGNITCCITYTPNRLLSNCIDATLCSENGHRQIVNITRSPCTDPKVKLESTLLRFDYIPVNLPLEGTTALINLEKEPIAFVVLNSQPIDGVNVSPVEGIIPPCGEQVLTIHIRIPTCISFEITVCIGINNDKVLELKITGKVLYPEIVCKPEVVKLKKIVAHAFERQVLIINNKSAVNATVQFCLDEYVEYHIFDERSVDLSSQAITEITLLPKSQKELYLHFNPMGAAVYCFYLPMVVNGIFGPTFLNAPETLNPAYFTKSKTESYANLDYVNIVQIPKKMPVCLVSTTVGCDTLKFTKMNVSFKYYPGDLHSETEADIKIWNASQDTCTFCIRTDNLGKPFTLQHQSGNRLELKEYSMVCQLDPQEDVTLHATFRPTFEGTYFIKLPIYLRHYASGSIFNYLSFTGYYPKPVISTNPGTIYFEPVVPTCQTEQVVTLTTRYHNMGCNISVSSNLGELKAQFGERRANHGNGEVDVILTCSAKKSTIIDGHIDVSCSCGALLKLAIKGLVENTLPTIHALLVPLRHESISFNSTLQMDAILDIDAASSSVSSFVQEVIVNYNETCFPRFPDEDDGSEYAVHMRRVCLAMEEWISHQGLYGKKYFKIPEGIAAPPHMSHSEEKQGNGSKKSNSTSLKYIDLLLNLIGSTSLKYINIRSLPDDYLERVNTIYNTYEQVIEFVTVQGGLLPHVSPEHLLVYGDYVSFYRDIFPNRSDYIGETVPKTLTNSEFYRLSKQSWLDLLLQSYKVFVLAKVQAPTKERPKSVNTSDVVSASIDSCGTYKPSENSDFWNSFADLDSSNFYQKSEMILLYWLEYHYNNVIDTHWLDFARHSHQPIPKKISNFDYDLRDGLALIAVTISYCHYLTPFFSDIYLAPTSEEQALHNASKLLESWNEINLSYSILPRQITLPNCIEMLMLVNYLFEVLPSYSAHNVLYFKTGLSTTCSKEIEVENASEALVGYAVILLGNNRDLFQINEHEIELAPFGKAKLRITFSAKFLEEERATLILNGESCRKPHAKSMAFQLVGEAVRSYCTSVINIPVPIYKIAELELSVQSPYGSAATYHINYSYDEPIDDSVGIISAQVAQNRRIPRAITCSDVLINFDDEGIGSYRINACCITTSKTSTWVIFTNSTFGNFTINIIIMPQFHDDLYCNLEVPLGTIFRKANCTCKNGANLMNKGCPRRIPLKIPCRNDFLWNALSDLVLGTADETEIDFWKRYIGTTAGIEIQKWLMKSESDDEEFKAIRSVFRSTKKYSITVESSLPQIIVPPYTSIGNVFHWDNHEIFIHMDYERQLNSDLKIKLESIDGHEYRFYNISFST